MTEKSAEIKQDFALKRIYVTDFSFEAPQTFQAFTEEWEPDIGIDLGAKQERINEELFEVQVSLTITAKNAGKIAFIIEIHQAGIFLCRGFDEDGLHKVLNTVCPDILFPYAREAVDNMVVRGSFPALMLEPVHFEHIYAQAMKDRNETASGV